MRRRYVDHLLRVVPDGCRMLLLTFEYDQNVVAGPPHCVLPEEVNEHYSERCEIKQLDSIVTSALPPHFIEQGVAQVAEGVYLITKLQ
jgi:thiopurine S-methyltransferase